MSGASHAGPGGGPSRAMVLAAGRGERLRPLTDRVPKPLIEVRGRTLLDGVLDHLAAAGVNEAVVNLHHLGAQIEAHLAGRRRPRIVFSREPALLDTGGGVRAALRWLGEAPFFVANGDVMWLDGPAPALGRLARAWDGARMDALLLVQPVAEAYGYDGAGDFLLDTDGRLRRRRAGDAAALVFAGVQILAPGLFAGAPAGAFSLNRLYDRAAAAGRLYGLCHDGAWLHIGTPAALAGVEAALDRLGSAPARDCHRPHE